MEWSERFIHLCVYLFSQTSFWWYSTKEWIEEMWVSLRPIYIIEATEYCKNGDIYDVTEGLKYKLVKGEVMDWESVSSEETDYIEVCISFYGKRKRLFFNNQTKFFTNQDLMYAILRYKDSTRSGSTDVTSLLKEYANMELKHIDFKHIQNNIGFNIPENSTVELIVSNMTDMDEDTYKLSP